MKEYTLKHPITKGERTIESLTFGQLKVMHLRSLDTADGEIGKTLALLSAMTGEPEVLLDEMDPEDFAHLSKFMGELLENFTTGQQPAS